jgi:hypothetical protein
MAERSWGALVCAREITSFNVNVKGASKLAGGLGGAFWGEGAGFCVKVMGRPGEPGGDCTCPLTRLPNIARATMGEEIVCRYRLRLVRSVTTSVHHFILKKR